MLDSEYMLYGLLILCCSACLGRSTPFYSNPISGSEPDRGCSFNSFCLLLIFIFFVFFVFVFVKVWRPESSAQPEGRIQTEAWFTPTFFIYLIKTFYLCHFVLGFSITRKHFQMPHKHLLLYNSFTKWHIRPLQNDIQNNSSVFNSFFHKMSHVKKEMI